MTGPGQDACTTRVARPRIRQRDLYPVPASASARRWLGIPPVTIDTVTRASERSIEWLPASTPPLHHPDQSCSGQGWSPSNVDSPALPPQLIPHATQAGMGHAFIWPSVSLTPAMDSPPLTHTPMDSVVSVGIIIVIEIAIDLSSGQACIIAFRLIWLEDPRRELW